MTKSRKKTSRQRYMVTVIKNAFVEGVFQNAGATVEVSKDYYERVKKENDKQIIAI